MPRCAECNKRLPAVGTRPSWAKCRYCGKPVCEDCFRVHFPKCMALTWGFGTVDPETGAFREVEKPPKFNLD
jgi:hypothetical protein